MLGPVDVDGVQGLDGPSASPGFQPDLHRRSKPGPFVIASESKVSVRVVADVDGKPEADDEADGEGTERGAERGCWGLRCWGW